MTIRKLRGFTKICNLCLSWIWMQEISYKTWKAFEDFDRTSPHRCICTRDEIR